MNGTYLHSGHVQKEKYKMHTHHSWQILFERHIDCFDLLNFILLFDKAMLCSKEVNFQFKNSLFEMFLKFKAFPI